jgi:hypothetical protein
LAWDIFGRKKTKKQRLRENLERNVQKGKTAEDIAVMHHIMEGHEIVRTPKGQDFRVRERDLFGRVIKTYPLEVKGSKKAPLSDLQKKTKKKKSNYRVERYNPDW